MAQARPLHDVELFLKNKECVEILRRADAVRSVYSDDFDSEAIAFYCLVEMTKTGLFESEMAKRPDKGCYQNKFTITVEGKELINSLQ